MKIKHAPPGSTVKMNKTKAEVLSHGELGTRVNVITGDPEQVTLGKQIWSNESEVKPLHIINTDPPKCQNTEVSAKIGNNIPLTLF